MMQILFSPQAPAGAPAPQEPGGRWCQLQAADGRLIAAVHLQPQLGQSRARYSFHVGRVVHAAPELGLHQVQTTLQLGHDATGEAELSGFFAAPEADDAALDQVLQAALQGLAESPAQRVLAELPGWRDALGHSPFWHGLVRHFLPQQLEAAPLMERFGPGFDSHLGPLLPRQLIHATFLPPAAQAALGRVHTQFEPWAAALGRAGFADWQHVRIADGGPLLAAPLPLRLPRA